MNFLIKFILTFVTILSRNSAKYRFVILESCLGCKYLRSLSQTDHGDSFDSVWKQAIKHNYLSVVTLYIVYILGFY